MNERIKTPGDEAADEPGKINLTQKLNTGNNKRNLGIGLIVLAVLLGGYYLMQRSAAQQAAMLATMSNSNAQIAAAIAKANEPPPPDLPDELAAVIKTTSIDWAGKLVGKIVGREIGDYKAGEAIMLAAGMAPKYFGEVVDKYIVKNVERPFQNEANIAVNTAAIATHETRLGTIDSKIGNLQTVKPNGEIWVTPASSAIVMIPRQGR